MSKSQQVGFTLIEVLISIFVLALGVIGAAGMQLVTMRTTQQSGSQTVAVQLASEMADLMRANATQMDQADASNPFLGVSYKTTDAALTSPAKMCYGTANCNPAELAVFDVYEWKMRVKALLPGGRVEICRDTTPWSTITGSLAWCPASPSTTSTDPMVIKIGWSGKGKNPDGSVNTSGTYPPNVAIAVEAYTK
jgi:type IV pilus assembly protein PilV